MRRKRPVGGWICFFAGVALLFLAACGIQGQPIPPSRIPPETAPEQPAQVSPPGGTNQPAQSGSSAGSGPRKGSSSPDDSGEVPEGGFPEGDEGP